MLLGPPAWFGEISVFDDAARTHDAHAHEATTVLQVPHPRAHERDFVLAPWLEVQPDAELTGPGPIAALLARLRSAPEPEGGAA